MANDIPDEAVDTLLDVARTNASIFQRYFRLKARWLGVDRLRRYDLYAAISAAAQTYPYQEAIDLVLESFAEFDPEIADLARRVFDDQHIDSEVRPGKRGGAFCASILPELTPWVLQNYTGKANDMATMAHELGHAIHAMLASDHNTLVFHSSLPLAETASTFSEMLLVDKLLTRTTDPEVRRDLLFKQMDDAYGTIMRQSFFALFERLAHDAIRDGASVDDLSTLYLEQLREQFGDAVEVSDDFQHEWVAIPHFYNTPFYVYAYAFGQLLVLSLYKQYREEGDAFKPRYRAILAAGGSASPETILTGAGIDMRDAAFWQGGFDVLADLVAQLEALPLPESE
jgi:oligoendopeptidase F